MNDVQLYKSSTNKPFDVLMKDLKEAVEEFGYRISTIVEKTWSISIAVKALLCRSITNMSCCRSASLKIPGRSFHSTRSRYFVQKLIFVYSKGETTELRTLGYSAKLMAELLGHNKFENGPSDDQFAVKMAENFVTMDKIIQKAVA